MIHIPVLETPRLRLRAQCLDDFPVHAAFLASPRARGVGALAEVAAWGQFCHDLASWHLFGHGALMIERRDTGEGIGQVGINPGPLFPEQELDWLLYAGQEGQGFASEAGAA